MLSLILNHLLEIHFAFDAFYGDYSVEVEMRQTVLQCVLIYANTWVKRARARARAKERKSTTNEDKIIIIEEKDTNHPSQAK